MKAKDLRELIHKLKRDNYSDNDFNDLFLLSSEEFQGVLELSRTSSRYQILLDYYLYCYNDPDIPSALEFLEKNLEIENAKDFIANKIIEAENDSNAQSIYYGFDGWDVFNIQTFQSKQEYFLYLDTLSKMEDCDRQFLSDTSWVLINVEKNRIAIFQKLFNYYLEGSSIESDLYNYLQYLKSEEDIMTFFGFIQLEYDEELSTDLLVAWSDIQQNTDSTNPARDAIELAKDFLLHFNLASDFSELPYLFLNVDVLDYEETISIIQRIMTSTTKPSDMIQNYIDCDIESQARKILNQKIMKVLDIQDEQLTDEFFALLQSNYIKVKIFKEVEDPEEQSRRLDKIIDTFQVVVQDDQTRTEVMGNCLLHFPYKMWECIPLDAEIATLKMFWDHYTFYRDRKVFLEEDESTYAILQKISRLAPESLEIITSLLRTNLSFKRDFMENRHDALMDILFEKETEPSLGYIQAEYDLREQERVKQQESSIQEVRENPPIEKPVELKLVSELLDDYAIEDILIGFQDEEEITPKTLVRSFQYRNHQ